MWCITTCLADMDVRGVARGNGATSATFGGLELCRSAARSGWIVGWLKWVGRRRQEDDGTGFVLPWSSESQRQRRMRDAPPRLAAHRCQRAGRKSGTMSILCDTQIRELIGIEPFADNVKRQGKISYGVSSYGYDLRVGTVFKSIPSSSAIGRSSPSTPTKPARTTS
jgi:hypothetical protein